MVQREKSLYFKMNRSANESKFDILGFYYFLYLCSTHVSNFMILSRRLITARIISASSFDSKDCFDCSVIFFQGFVSVDVLLDSSVKNLSDSYANIFIYLYIV